MRANYPEDTTIQDLQRRLQDLERAPQLGRSSISSGALLFNDQGQLVFNGPDGPRRLTPAPPPPPANLLLIPGADETGHWIQVDWDDVEEADGYRIQVEEDGFGVINTLSAEISSVQIVRLKANTLYSVYVFAVTPAGFTASSYGQATTIPDGTVPVALTGLDAWGGLGSLITSWDLSVDEDVRIGGRYKVQVATNTGFTTNMQEFATVGQVLTVTGLADGVWYVRVRAVDAAGNHGPWSAHDSTTVLAPPAGRNFTTNPILTTEITPLAVTSPLLAANSVIAGKIAADAVVAGTVAAGAIRAVDAAFEAAAIQSADINDLTASKLTTGSLSAATITLSSAGVLRAGTGSAPWNYLTLSATGLSFFSGGTAAYTGGTRKLLLDVATGTAEFLGDVSIGGNVNTESRFTVMASDGTPIFNADKTGVSSQQFSTNTLVVNGENFGIATANRTIYVNSTVGSDAYNGSQASVGTAPNGPMRTITAALAQVPKYVWADITISIAPAMTYYEDVIIQNFTGPGTLTLRGGSPTTSMATIYGSMLISGCAMRMLQVWGYITVQDSGATSEEKTNAAFKPIDSYYTTPRAPGTISVIASRFVVLQGNGPGQYLRADAQSRRRSSIFCGRGADVFLQATEHHNARDAGIWAAYHGNVLMLNPVGSPNPGSFAYVAHHSARIATYGTTQIDHRGGLREYLAYDGTIVGDNAVSVNLSAGAGVTPTQRTDVFYATGGNSYRPAGWRNDGTVRQGQWAGNGAHEGIWFFDSASIRANTLGRTINSVRFICHRQSSGGVYGAQAYDFHDHAHTATPAGAPVYYNLYATATFAAGDWGTVHLPVAVGERLRDNLIHGVGMGTETGPYGIFDATNGTRLEITSTG